jgi:hypothetical protein
MMKLARKISTTLIFASAATFQINISGAYIAAVRRLADVDRFLEVWAEAC